MNTRPDPQRGSEASAGDGADMEAYPWAEPASAFLDALESTPLGLTADEVRSRQKQHGPNCLPTAPRAGPLRWSLRQFNNLLILAMIAAAAITALLQHWVDTAVIMAVVVINAVIGFVQEGTAEAALESLRDMLAPRADVLRAGTRATVQAVELVCEPISSRYKPGLADGSDQRC
jgi:magnesium-transporting ATPase (P-type)